MIREDQEERALLMPVPIDLYENREVNRDPLIFK
jgi:hypothetical protein